LDSSPNVECRDGRLSLHEWTPQEGEPVHDGSSNVITNVSNSDRPEDMVPRLLQAARRHLGMDVAFVSELTERERVFRWVDASDPGPVAVGDADPREESYCQRVVDGRLPELVPDAAAEPAVAGLPSTATLPVGAHVSVPLVLSDGRVYGTFCCFSHGADHSLTPRDLRVVRMFADLARQSLEADLDATRRRALVQRRIDAVLTIEGLLGTVYQPVVGLEDGRVIGLEALSRFPASWGGTPDVWFGEAATLGLGVELEVRAVRSATVALDRLPADRFLAVNVSPDAVLSGLVAEALADVDVARVVLEMTEHAPVADYDALDAALRPLRRQGLRVAVDDAGAGYASFRHILRLQPEWIKIDSSITSALDADPARAALAAALIGFARGTGSDVIAEGIETEEELRVLQSLGATAGQGYHLGRPAALPAHHENGVVA
jgi:EAL domain-containing protein (putative c-di-GMP-specific phosphodiesterase class I)